MTAGDAVRPGHAGAHALSYRSWASWLLGYPRGSPYGPLPGLSYAREIGQAANVDVCVVHTSMFSISLWKLRGRGSSSLMSLSLWRNAKGTLLWERTRTNSCKGGSAVLEPEKFQTLLYDYQSGIDAVQANWSDFFIPLVRISRWLASAMPNLAESMTLAAPSVK